MVFDTVPRDIISLGIASYRREAGEYSVLPGMQTWLLKRWGIVANGFSVTQPDSCKGFFVVADNHQVVKE